MSMERSRERERDARSDGPQQPTARSLEFLNLNDLQARGLSQGISQLNIDGRNKFAKHFARMQQKTSSAETPESDTRSSEHPYKMFSSPLQSARSTSSTERSPGAGGNNSTTSTTSHQHNNSHRHNNHADTVIDSATNGLGRPRSNNQEEDDVLPLRENKQPPVLQGLKNVPKLNLNDAQLLSPRAEYSNLPSSERDDKLKHKSHRKHRTSSSRKPIPSPGGAFSPRQGPAFSPRVAS